MSWFWPGQGQSLALAGSGHGCGGVTRSRCYSTTPLSLTGVEGRHSHFREKGIPFSWEKTLLCWKEPIRSVFVYCHFPCKSSVLHFLLLILLLLLFILLSHCCFQQTVLIVTDDLGLLCFQLEGERAAAWF